MQSSEVLNSGLNSHIFTAACSWRCGVTHDFNNVSLCTYSVFAIFPRNIFIHKCFI